jgi:regulator of cell morphogenesis and NO signaling
MSPAPLANKVLSRARQRRPELAEVVALVSDLTTDLLPHMLNEEPVLFPFVQQPEAAAASGQPAPTPCFGTVRNLVRMMMLAHDRVGELFARLRIITGDYTPPVEKHLLPTRDHARRESRRRCGGRFHR